MVLFGEGQEGIVARMSTSSSKNRIVICHFSDLHLVPDRPIDWSRLLSKRALGFANLKFNRGRTHKEEFLMRLMAEVAKENADCTLVTGDFTSLALDFEFEKISRMFRLAGLKPERTMVLPGNHDRYTRAADTRRAFERGMSDWLPEGFATRGQYPLVRHLGNVCLIGMDTAVWRGPVRAAGEVDTASVSRMGAILNSPENRSQMHVIAMHHPPFRRSDGVLKDFRTGLVGWKRMLRVIPGNALILHGHTHVASRRRDGRFDIVGVPSASNNTGNDATQLAYNKYSIEADGAYVVEAVRFRPTADGREIRSERTVMPDSY